MNKKKALIVVDYQVDFVNGSLGFPGAEKLEPGIAARAKEYQEQGGIVIFTKDTHDENYLQTQEGKKLPIVHCVEGTNGWKIFGNVLPMVNAETENLPQIILKNNFGCQSLANHISSTLYDYNAELESIELCGLVTNICVIANAVILKTAFPEAPILINEKLCASFDPELHQKAIDVMRGLQMEII